MEIFCGGVRGTETITDASCAEFGGDTTSFRIQHSSGDFIILDLGSGVRSMESFLTAKKPAEIKILMSHYHLDHLCGMPKFQPIYNPDISVHVRGPVLGDHTCESVFRRVLSSPLWPVPLDSLTGNVFETLPGDNFIWGGFNIRTCTLHHFEGCMAYRFEEESGGAAAVIATDVEWGEATPEEKSAFIALCSEPTPAKILFFDGHMSPQSYECYKGWGHSTWSQALDVANEARVEQLFITHHAPQHDDETLTVVESELQIDEPAAGFARQGQTIAVS